MIQRVGRYLGEPGMQIQPVGTRKTPSARRRLAFVPGLHAQTRHASAAIAAHPHRDLALH